MTKLRREKKLIPQEQKGLGDKGRRRFDTRSTADSEMYPTPTTRPALIFKALSPADSTGPLPSSLIPDRSGLIFIPILMSSGPLPSCRENGRKGDLGAIRHAAALRLELGCGEDGTGAGTRECARSGFKIL